MKKTEKTKYGDITIDGERGTITLLQRWKYVSWELAERSTNYKPKAWTDAEKAVFHETVVAQIIAGWGQGVRFTPTGINPFLKKYKSSGLKFIIDIRRVIANSDWKIIVREVPENARNPSAVKWYSKTLVISASTETITHRRDNPKDLWGTKLKSIVGKQTAAAHEFGHMIGYRHDEYKNTSTHYTDSNSMMSVGSELRKRHFREIDAILDKMVILTDFDVDIKSE